MKDKDKTKEQLISELVDLHRQRALLEKTYTSDQQTLNLFALSPDGIVTIGLKGAITACNQAFLSLSGFDGRDIVGKHLTTF